MYRKTLICQGRRGCEGGSSGHRRLPSQPPEASSIPKGEPEVTLSLLHPTPRHSLALTETAKATGPVKLHMSVS